MKVFCDLVFFIEISVKKRDSIIRTALSEKICLLFRVFETETIEKQTRNYQKKLPKNWFLAYFHIIIIEKNEIVNKKCDKLPIIWNYSTQNFINNGKLKRKYW